MNQIILSGRLVGKTEIYDSKTSQGKKVLKSNIRVYLGKDKLGNQLANFYSFSCSASNDDYILKFQPGKWIVLQGKISYRDEMVQGVQKRFYDVWADKVEFPSDKVEEAPQTAQKRPSYDEEHGLDPISDDLPF